ncbi:MAG: alpha-galactosidase [Lachnospiraceae bacterium]|nr:alpha-galactosidase [Lachnospiraceae bacterium]
MISFNPASKTFKLDTPNTSYVFAVGKEFGHLVHYYYGPKVSDDNLSYLSLQDPNATQAWVEREKLSYVDCVSFEYPTGGTGDFRTTAMEVETQEGYSVLELKYDSHEIYKGKRKLSGLPATFAGEDECQSLDVILKDDILGLKVVLTYSVFENLDAITRSVKVINEGKAIYLTKVMSTCLDLYNEDFEVLKLCGTWARERRMERYPLAHGYQGISSKRGISSHQENPFIALVSPNTTQTQGQVYAMNLVYSGNFDADIYRNQFDYARMTMGINPYKFKWKLETNASFEAPEAVMVYSAEGLGKMTRTFHDLYRKHLIRSPYKNMKRPILINNWEATYFDFNTEKLLDIAREASKVGIEMLVMDDGWFGDRNDDNKALGDWIVNEKKLPGGLKYLVDEVNKLGLKFGIWMEPEMICPDSDLYRAHPDWAIAVPGRVAGKSRNQYVLDLTRSEVMEHTWNSIKAVVDSANIEYVKWDMNRPLADIASLGLDNDRQGEFFHRYVMAVYELQGRLVSSYPNLLLENCSGGGGRFDPGMLYFSPQIWCSDDTDAVERLRIQEGTALVYPLSSMGAHVSDCPNHILGRVTPFETRGHVALAGTFGYELDITKISKEDRDEIPKQVEMYHKYNDLVREGDYYRLASFADNNEYDCWMVKAKDESEILVTFVSVMNRPNMKPLTIKLQGLDASRKYKDLESGMVYTGDMLMYAGIRESRIWGDYKSKLIHLVEVK